MPILRYSRGLEDYRDMVSGYTIRQIEDALRGSRKWNTWRDRIINNYNNASERYVVQLFFSW